MDCLDQLPAEPCCLVGWSLGAMLALRLAVHYPARVAGLLLVSATPRFVCTEGWSHGIDVLTFSAFRSGLGQNPARTLRRFSALMWKGEECSRFREYDPCMPDVNSLAQGLCLLEQWDLREEMARVHCPVRLVHGRRDALIPWTASQAMTRVLPRAKLRVLDAGHALPLTQADALRDELRTLMENWSSKEGRGHGRTRDA